MTDARAADRPMRRYLAWQLWGIGTILAVVASVGPWRSPIGASPLALAYVGGVGLLVALTAFSLVLRRRSADTPSTGWAAEDHTTPRAALWFCVLDGILAAAASIALVGLVIELVNRATPWTVAPLLAWAAVGVLARLRLRRSLAFRAAVGGADGR